MVWLNFYSPQYIARKHEDQIALTVLRYYNYTFYTSYIIIIIIIENINFQAAVKIILNVYIKFLISITFIFGIIKTLWMTEVTLQTGHGESIYTKGCEWLTVTLFC